MIDIKHLSFEDLVALAAGRELPPPSGRHLQTCDECQKALQEMAALRQDVLGLDGEDHPAEDDLRALHFGALGADEALKLRLHVDSCAHCENTQRRIERESRVAVVRPSPRVVEDVKQAYRKEMRKSLLLQIIEAAERLAIVVVPAPPPRHADMMFFQMGFEPPSAPPDRSATSVLGSLAKLGGLKAPPSKIERPRRQRPRPAPPEGIAGMAVVRSPMGIPRRPAPRGVTSEPVRIEGHDCILTVVAERSGATRSLRVRAESKSTGQPLPGVQLDYQDPAGDSRPTLTDRRGQATLLLEDGPSRLRVPAYALDIEIDQRASP